MIAAPLSAPGVNAIETEVVLSAVALKEVGAAGVVGMATVHALPVYL